jgi:hypothetical protein
MLDHEVDLAGEGDPRVVVEHQPKQRRARPLGADQEDGRPYGTTPLRRPSLVVSSHRLASMERLTNTRRRRVGILASAVAPGKRRAHRPPIGAGRSR